MLKFRKDVYCENVLHEARNEDQAATYELSTWQPDRSLWVCGRHLRWGVRELVQDDPTRAVSVRLMLELPQSEYTTELAS